MTAKHLELLVEDLSTEAFVRALLPRILPTDRSFEAYSFQGKTDMLAKLERRLRAYASWLPVDWRVLVVLDCDNDDCEVLKQQLEDMAAAAKLRTRSQTPGSCWQVVTRIAIEELEAWYFGEWEAVRTAYPRVSPNVPKQARYRNPDSIRGGTWEAFEGILKRAGYFQSGLRKIEAARTIGANVDPTSSRSQSFLKFRDAILEVTA